MPMPPAQPQAVIDYASPRPRGKLRLPSNSVLAVSRYSDGLVDVETLSGKRKPILAICFAASSMALLAGTFFDDYSGPMESVGFAVYLVPPVLLAGVIVMALVINNTWRRTTLRVHRVEVALEFAAPFGRQRYLWPAGQVENVRVERTSEGTSTFLAELQLHPTGAGIVHLFTDHPERELVPLGEAIQQTLELAPRDVTILHTDSEYETPGEAPAEIT